MRKLLERSSDPSEESRCLRHSSHHLHNRCQLHLRLLLAITRHAWCPHLPSSLRLLLLTRQRALVPRLACIVHQPHREQLCRRHTRLAVHLHDGEEDGGADKLGEFGAVAKEIADLWK